MLLLRHLVLWQACVYALFVGVYKAVGLPKHFTSTGGGSLGTVAYYALVTQSGLGSDIYPKTGVGRLLVSLHLLLAWIPTVLFLDGVYQ